jgi:asparagine synthase (glutamine-hydrolysing)
VDRSWIATYLSLRRIRREGYFDPDAVQSLHDRYRGSETTVDLLFEDDLLMVVITHGLFLELFDLPSLH